MPSRSEDDKGLASPNLIDKAIEYFSPQRALKRSAARILLDRHSRTLQKRQYAAAKTTRLTGAWTPVDLTVNELIRSSQQTVRARVRQLVRDFPYFSRAVTVLTDLVVGTGIDFQSRIKLPSGKYNSRANDQIEYAFSRWSEKADLAGKLSFDELTRLSERGELETGESLFIMHRVPGRFIPFALQPIEPDRLASSYLDIKRSREIEGGIEHDPRTGEALFYHILEDGYNAKTIKIPASMIIHTFQMLRPGQMRGISPFTSAVLAADDLHQYLDATMDVAKLASKYLAFVTSPDNTTFQSLRTTDGEEAGQKVEEIENAIIEYLQPGESINFASHQIPSDQFDPFTRFILRMVAVGTGTSFELLSGDYTGLSYSNLKAIRADLVRGIKPRFDRRRVHFCQPTFSKVLEWGVLSGRISLPGYVSDPYQYERCQWIWQGMESPDPLRETRAVVDEIKMGLKSPQEHVASRGRDLEEVLDELAEAKEMMEARGLTWGDVSLSLQTNPSTVDPKSSGDDGDRKILPMRKRNNEERIITRALPVTPASMDRESRSVFVTMATENPVDVWHWEHGVVSEVLLMDGAESPKRIPLLDTHNRYSSSAVIGSVGDISISGRELIGKATFSKTADDILTKVEEGHLTDFSVGYRAIKSVYVPEKESQVINGRSFGGPVLVTTNWKIKELSICPIGADENAKARAEAVYKPKGDSNMDEKLRQMLIARGLAENATDEQAWQFLDGLTRTDPSQPPQAPESPAQTVSVDDSVRAERERVLEITGFGERFGMAEEARGAIINGASIDSFRMMVFEKKMSEPQPSPLHRVDVVAEERDKIRAATTDSILMRGGVSIEKPALGAEDFMGHSLREIAREMLFRAGIKAPANVMEMVGRAMTTSDFPLILANVANKSLFTGFNTADETWKMWCATGSVSDFKTHHSVRLSEADDLDEIPEAVEYKYGKRTEGEEQYRVVTYGKMFAITRQAIINDDLNALTTVPMAHGESAARKIGDLPYAVLSANANMGDGTALFHADHDNNAVNAAVSVASLAAGILAMKSQKDLRGLRRLNIRPQYFLGSVASEGTVEQFFRTNLIGGAANQPNLDNPYAGTYFTRIYEPRIDDDSTTVWYLIGPKGKTVTVFFLNGVQSPYMETKEGWSVDGIEYKVRIDAGAKAMDWRAMYRNAGA
jgi:lambda family phage portal protein